MEKVGVAGRATSTVPGPKGDMIEVSGEDGRIVWVDPDTGHVRGVIGELRAADRDLRSELTTSAAQALAFAAVRSINPAVTGMELVRCERINSSFNFMWQRVDKNGVMLPQWAAIGVEADTGAMGSYTSESEPVEIDTKPILSRRRAQEVAKGLVPDGALEAWMRLQVMRDRNRRQTLVWYAAYSWTETDPTAQARGHNGTWTASRTMFIDAKTGEDVTARFY